MKQKIIIALFVVGLNLLLCACSNDKVAGKSVVDETTNGLQAKVILADGSPARSARVSVIPGWYVEGLVDTANHEYTTDSKGVLDVKSIPVGSYWIEVRKGNVGVRTQWASSSKGNEPQTLTLSELGSIRGKATPGAKVRVYGSSRVVTADANGDYELESLPPGRWSLRLDQDTLVGEALVEVSAHENVAEVDFSSLQFDPSTWMQSYLMVVAPDSLGANDSLQNVSIPITIDAGMLSGSAFPIVKLQLATSKGQFLSYDVEEWSTTMGVGVIWVNMPIVHPSRGDSLYLLWNKNTKGAPSDLHSLADSIYGVWRFGEAAPYEDASGVGPKITVDSGSLQVQGLWGQARKFSGNHWLAVAAPSETAIENAFTISCWVKLDGVQSSFAKIMQMGTSGPPFGSVLFDVDPTTGRMAYQMAFADSTYKRIVATDSATGWVFLASTFDKAQRKASFYVNGALQGEIPIDTTVFSYAGHDLLIGSQENGEAGLNGLVDEFRFELRARSAAWIRHRYLVESGLNTNWE